MYIRLALALMGLWSIGMVLMVFAVHNVLSKDWAPSAAALERMHLPPPGQ
jgi:hypothetical protein